MVELPARQISINIMETEVELALGAMEIDQNNPELAFEADMRN